MQDPRSHVPAIAPRREPAINIPTPLLVAVAILVMIHAARAMLSPETDLRLLLETAFVPAPWTIAAGLASPDDVVRTAEAAGGDSQSALVRVALARYFGDQAPRLWSPLSYAVLHGSWAHLGLNSLWLIAFGTSVFRRAGWVRALVLAIVAAFGGAVAQWIAGPQSPDIMIGASASVSGMMAAAATFIYARPHEGRWAFLGNRGALIFLGIWLVGNLVFGLIAGPLGLADGDVAWQAHIGGLVAGLLCFPLIDPAHREPGAHYRP